MIALKVFTNVIRAENGVGSINIGMRKQGYHYLQIIVLKKKPQVNQRVKHERVQRVTWLKYKHTKVATFLCALNS